MEECDWRGKESDIKAKKRSGGCGVSNIIKIDKKKGKKERKRKGVYGAETGGSTNDLV